MVTVVKNILYLCHYCWNQSQIFFEILGKDLPGSAICRCSRAAARSQLFGGGSFSSSQMRRWISFVDNRASGLESSTTRSAMPCLFTWNVEKIKTRFKKEKKCLQPVSRPVELILGFYPKGLNAKRCLKSYRRRQACFQTSGNRIGEIWPNFFTLIVVKNWLNHFFHLLTYPVRLHPYTKISVQND